MNVLIVYLVLYVCNSVFDNMMVVLYRVLVMLSVLMGVV